MPQITDFQEAMDTKCRNCGEKAALHRITKKGKVYCLILREEWGKAYHGKPSPYACGVEHLRPGWVRRDAVETIKAGIETYIEEPTDD